KLSGELESMIDILGFSKIDARSTKVSAQESCHQTEWSRSQNGNRLATHICFVNCVHCIAESIKHGPDVGRDLRSIATLPEQNCVFIRNDYMLGEASIEMHALYFYSRADVLVAGPAESAVTAGEMHFSGDVVALLDPQMIDGTVLSLRSRTNFLDDAAEF